MVLVWRLGRLVAVLLGVSLLTFLLIELLPGDPAVTILQSGATTENVARVHHDLGLDKPLPERYARWLGNVVQGDLGRSYQNHQSVTQLIRERLPVTLELLLLAQLMALAIAIPVAVISAYRPNGIFDRVATATSFGFLAIPPFALAVVLIYLFAVTFHVFPASGYTKLGVSVGDNLRSVFLPSVTLAVGLVAVYARLLRSDMIATLQEDYILMARAEGLPPRRILLRHALRPSSFSLLTVAGISMGTLIGGSVIIEFLFALPGMGSLLVTSILRRDYLVVQGVVLLVATAYVLINFGIDRLYGVVDPRVRHVRAR